MEAFALILIGLLARFEVASHRHEAVNVRSPASVATLPCQLSADATWIANLEIPDAPRWLIRDTGEICDPLTGQRVAIEGLQYPEIP